MKSNSVILDDFTGGRSTLKSLDLIKDTESPDQENTWNEVLALSQRRGFTTTVISINSKSPIPEQLKSTQLGGSSLQLLAIIGNVTADSKRYLVTTTDGSTFNWAGYGVGTFTTTGSSTTINGSGTAWLTHAAIGDFFLPAGGSPNVITAVNSDTQIVVTSALNIGIPTAYTIVQVIVAGHPAGMALFDLSGAQNLYLADGSRAYRYDGTNVYRTDPASGVSMPAFRYLLAHKNYLFGIQHDSPFLAVRWCNIKDPTSWPAANFQTVTVGGDQLRGMVKYGDYIVFFTRSRMFRFLGDVFDPTNPQYLLQAINVPPNFLFKWPRTAVVHQGILKFLTIDGWYGYIGGPGIEKLSTDIQPDTDGFYKLIYTTEDMITSASAIVWKNRMWCCVPDNTKTPTNQVNTIYMLDERDKWHKWPTATGSAAGSFSDFEVASFGSTGAYQLLGGNIQTNKLSVLDTGNTDDSGAISGYFITKEFTFPTDLTFVFARVSFKFQSAGNLILGYSIDRRSFVSKNLDMTTGAGTVITRNVPIGSVGKSIRFKFSNSTANQTFEVYKVELITEPSEAMRA